MLKDAFIVVWLEPYYLTNSEYGDSKGQVCIRNLDRLIAYLQIYVEA